MRRGLNLIIALAVAALTVALMVPAAQLHPPPPRPCCYNATMPASASPRTIIRNGTTTIIVENCTVVLTPMTQTTTITEVC